MGGMMTSGTAYVWAIVLILAVMALTAASGVVVARVLRARDVSRRQVRDASESRAADGAQEALRMRYASGEISREDYLQAKIELED
jgi:putative membrane protein